ncbi:UvrB/UvrC motif-containing protein [bacterium]|nr:UvrB/UvrC motif-containing protein [bacterium]
MARVRYLDYNPPTASSQASLGPLNKISLLPQESGVYIFKKAKEILYIGKAVNIRERVKNHFQQPSFRDNLFIQEVEKIGYLKTDSEIEALILEANLIKKYQPKFNILWRDDKNYFFVGVTKEEFPRVFITHQTKLKIKNEKLKINYIGPFVEGRALKQTLKILRKVFPFRTCKKIPKHPCLWYQLRRCPAPCLLKSKVAAQLPKAKENIKRECQKNAKSIIKILQGKKTQLLTDLRKEMKKLSKSQEFEKAAKLRDQIEALENIFEHARVSSLIELERANWKDIEKRLRKILDTKRRIERIEGYDISNIQGKKATGAMVVFENGIPNKTEYRKFKIKIAGKPNDIAMIKEVLTRRLKHQEWKFPDLILIDGGMAQLNAALKIKNRASKKSKAREENKLLFDNQMEKRTNFSSTIKNIKVIALAKRKNELYMEDKKKPVLLKNLPQEIASLILHLRDEAHRFALTYHKILRKKGLLG